MKLSDIAQVVRSKNAGPRRLTLDLMFATDAVKTLGRSCSSKAARLPADLAAW